MENTIPLQTEKIPDADSFFLASSVLVGSYQTVRDIHVLVAALLRYAMIGSSITDCLLDLIVSTVAEEC